MGAHLHESHRTLRERLFWGGVVPGTSCQATITSSLRDISQWPLDGAGSSVLVVLVDRDAASSGERLKPAYERLFGNRRSGLPEELRREVIDRSTEDAIRRLCLAAAMYCVDQSVATYRAMASPLGAPDRRSETPRPKELNRNFDEL
jgi:hypothetical protein